MLKLIPKPGVALPPSLSLAPSTSPPGTEVWAVGFPEFGFTVTKGIVTGSHSAGGLTFKDTSSREEICPACGGKGYQIDAFGKHADDVADVWAKANPNDPAYRADLQEAVNRLIKLWHDFPNAFLDARRSDWWTTPNGPRQLGKSFLAAGYLLRKIEGPDAAHSLWLVKCGRILYVVSQPIICQGVASDHVLFGGIFAGALTLDNDETIPVLQHGFLVTGE